MATFKYNGYSYNLTSFYEFLNEFNIKNDEIANEKNLNKAVNQLKRELNQVIGTVKILTSEEAILWNSMVKYEPGEIVSYFRDSKPTHTKEEIQASFYLALPSEFDNIAIAPTENADMWKNITIKDLYPSLYLENFVTKNQEQADWQAVQDFAVVNIKKLTDTLESFKTNFKKELDEIFISFKNEKSFDTINQYNVASKKYVDSEAKKLSDSVLNLDSRLKDYVKIDLSNSKMTVASMPNAALATPNEGLLPGAPNVSNIGSELKKFANVYASNFVGTATAAKYADIAEIFETQQKFEPGTIIALSPHTGDFVLWEPQYEIFGVVSSKPGFILNADVKGVLVAHKGMVPVLVNGEVRKGQILIADSEGKAKPVDSLDSNNRHLKIGIALESGFGVVNAKI